MRKREVIVTMAKEKFYSKEDRKEKKKEKGSDPPPPLPFLPPNPFPYKGTSQDPLAKAAHVSLGMGMEGTLAKHCGRRQPEPPFSTQPTRPSAATATGSRSLVYLTHSPFVCVNAPWLRPTGCLIGLALYLSFTS